VDDLFALPPAGFTAARDALAKRLKAEGDAAAAAEVKALRRPSAAAWAVNQVARGEPDLVVAVVDAGRAVADALASGDREGLRTATARRRESVSAATRAAVAVAGEQHRDEIADTFEAAATDDESAALVTAGRLTKGLTPTAVFAPFGDAPAPTKAPKPKRDDEAIRTARERAEEADRAVLAARHALAELEAAAKAAWAEVERLRH